MFHLPNKYYDIITYPEKKFTTGLAILKTSRTELKMILKNVRIVLRTKTVNSMLNMWSVLELGLIALVKYYLDILESQISHLRLEYTLESDTLDVSPQSTLGHL